MKKIYTALLAATLLATPALALAQVAQDASTTTVVDGGPTQPTVDPGEGTEFAKTVLDAFAMKKWLAAAALLLVAAVYLLRRFLAPKWPWLATDRGGAVAVMAVSLLGAVASALLSGAFGWGTLLDAVIVGFMAAGGWTWVKRMMAPAPAVP